MGLIKTPDGLPARLQPYFGGDPLPLPPICLPGVLGSSGLAREAAKYRALLDKELNTGDEQKKWSGSQRQYIRLLRAKWRMRELGEDAHYLKHGTFIRPFNAEPPGWGDYYQAVLRRKEEDKTGIKVSSAAHYRKNHDTHSDRNKRIVKRWALKHGTKQKKVPLD